VTYLVTTSLYTPSTVDGLGCCKGERHMRPVDGSLARKLEFEHPLDHVGVRPSGSVHRFGLLRGPDKYKVLERRRRAAQIRARHALDLIDLMERAPQRT
jgi:hypothetical protein